MADTEKTQPPASPVSPPTRIAAPPESPTTARPLDFDDEGAELTSAVQSPGKPPPPPKEALAPPSKPPRPLSPREQAELTLREAFPSIDATVVKAVLSASGGQVEPAFNALLGMSDPDSQREAPAPALAPPKPARPIQRVPTSTAQSQLEADEMYARQLAEHYNGSGVVPAPVQRRPSDRYNEQLKGSRIGRPGAKPNPDDVPWRSFIDDDLPEIRDNIKKGFIETQSAVNKWLGNLKKKIDGEEGEGFSDQRAQPAQGYATDQGGFGRRSGDVSRRSADMQRYDADPQVIGDDFSKLELRDSDIPPPRTSSRPVANPDLFRTGAPPQKPRRPPPEEPRKVSFQQGPPEEIADMYSSSTAPAGPPTARPASGGGKTSKWQPISVVEPSPVAENDPFSLGDSEDERDAKPITLRDDEDERLKAATEEAMKDSISAGETKK